MNNPTVIDIFCGAGGFSEGFKQQGYKILHGVDHWEPAIKTFNHNFNLKCKTKNILDFKDSIEEIESLPDTDVIIGSPPCVTFSSSNISGKADKSSGVALTEVFLRIVAVKKWKKDSRLKAWFMENVTSSINHLKEEYTFNDLGLANWAKKNKIRKTQVAISLIGNQEIINSADYGSPQSRERVISGESVSIGKLIIPSPTHSKNGDTESSLKSWITLKRIKGKLPKPTCHKSSRRITDPNYPWISISLNKLTDHFYDSGLYEGIWRQSKFYKTNHPYMGRMAFPENENKPSRTITATNIRTSREAIIYSSGYSRKEDGEYRTHTVREAASLMGFPITYQFVGGEGTKQRLVGNAVCPSVARAFAKQLGNDLGFQAFDTPQVEETPRIIPGNNLNTFTERHFSNPPRRNIGSRFRRHPFKDGNITVTLSNYNIETSSKDISKWTTSVQYGNGNGFPTENYPDNFHRSIEHIIKEVKKGQEFLNIINNGFLSAVGDHNTLQEMYESRQSQKSILEPTILIEELARLIDKLQVEKDCFVQNGEVVFRHKEIIPVKQLFALYAINKITTKANNSI
jgi:DNA (cytosine-5)-methyltransferase 1